MKKLAAIAALAIGLALTGCGVTEDDPPATVAETSNAPAPKVTPTAARKAVPEPSAAQQRAYLAALAKIDPGLAVNTERIMRRAGRICERIVQPPGGTLTLEKYTVLELSGGNATINEAQARQVIRAVKVWCR